MDTEIDICFPNPEVENEAWVRRIQEGRTHFLLITFIQVISSSSCSSFILRSWILLKSQHVIFDGTCSPLLYTYIRGFYLSAVRESRRGEQCSHSLSKDIIDHQVSPSKTGEEETLCKKWNQIIWELSQVGAHVYQGLLWGRSVWFIAGWQALGG